MSTSLAIESLQTSEEFEVYANAAAASGVNFGTLHTRKGGGKGPRGVIVTVGQTLTVIKFSGDSETVTSTTGFLPIAFSTITGGTATAFTVVW